MYHGINMKGNYMRRMFLDIETIPAPGSDLVKLKDLYESKKKKYEAREQKYSKKFQDFVEETNFSGSFGQILCLAYAINDEEVKILTGKEVNILKEFWQLAKNVDVFIGHNVMDFDLKFILQRSVIFQIKPTKELSFARYRSYPIYDTLREWQHWGGGNGLDSLDALAKALDLPTSKKGIDGSMVYKFYQADKLEEIYTYCKADVTLTRKVYKRMVFED